MTTFTHSSQLMAMHNLDTKTLRHVLCAPHVFKKLPENYITVYVIDQTFAKFATVSHISYWDQVKS